MASPYYESIQENQSSSLSCGNGYHSNYAASTQLYTHEFKQPGLNLYEHQERNKDHEQ